LAGLTELSETRKVNFMKMMEASQRASKASINEQVCCGTMKLLIPRYANMSEKMLLRRVLQILLLGQWVNEHLLANETLEPGCPRKISVETARHWLHELGFEVLTAKKGCFVDGHEREDVVKSRSEFLKMIGLGFLNESNAPTEKAKQSLPSNIRCPS